jgi:hypothetical protein
MNKPNSSLSQFIEEYPLYLKFAVDQPIEAADLDNLAFNFYCKQEKQMEPFRLLADSPRNLHSFAGNGSRHHSLSTESKIDFTEMFTGVCQSCESYKVNIIINGATQKEQPNYFIRKIGQYPEAETPAVRIPEELYSFLREESREFYRRALKNIEFEYGNGAIVYFWKVIKNELERIMEAMANPYSSGSNKLLEAFSCYEHDGQKTKFIEEATPLLPKSLQEHGAGILLMLHDVRSINLFDLDEKEYLKKAKDVDSLFRYVIRKIYTEINDATSPQGPNKYFLRYS